MHRLGKLKATAAAEENGEDASADTAGKDQAKPAATRARKPAGANKPAGENKRKRAKKDVETSDAAAAQDDDEEAVKSGSEEGIKTARTRSRTKRARATKKAPSEPVEDIATATADANADDTVDEEGNGDNADKEGQGA